MSTYLWRGRNKRGEPVSGQLEGLTESAIAEQLMAIGVAPVLIEPAIAKVDTTNALPAWLERWSRTPIVIEDMLFFTRQLYTLNKAGVPILRAFAGLQASATKPAMVDLCIDIRSSLDQGRELSVALGRHTDLFGGFYISMIRVGEMTGKLTEVFLRLTEHMEFERDVRERIKQAMRYPSFVLIAMAWMTNWWPLLLVMTAALVVAVRSYLATADGRYRWDARKLRLPIVGDILTKATLARFARSFALASQAGVPLVQGLTVVAQTVDNAFIGSRIEQMRDGIERGESISRCAAATGVFTPVVLQMIQVGEETGELDTLLFEIAEMYERDTDYAIKGLSTAIEPILLVFIGVLVLLLALGVFLPLWNLGQAAMGRGGG